MHQKRGSLSLRLEPYPGNERTAVSGWRPGANYYAAWQLVAWWKQSEDYGWLTVANAESLQQCLMDLEKPTRTCLPAAAPPAFRKKFAADSVRYPQGFKVDGRRVYLPQDRLGRVLGLSRPIEGAVKYVTVSRHGKHWFVAFQVEMDAPEPGAPRHRCCRH